MYGRLLKASLQGQFSLYGMYVLCAGVIIVCRELTY